MRTAAVAPACRARASSSASSQGRWAGAASARSRARRFRSCSVLACPQRRGRARGGRPTTARAPAGSGGRTCMQQAARSGESGGRTRSPCRGSSSSTRGVLVGGDLVGPGFGSMPRHRSSSRPCPSSCGSSSSGAGQGTLSACWPKSPAGQRRPARLAHSSGDAPQVALPGAAAPAAAVDRPRPRLPGGRPGASMRSRYGRHQPGAPLQQRQTRGHQPSSGGSSGRGGSTAMISTSRRPTDPPDRAGRHRARAAGRRRAVAAA